MDLDPGPAASVDLEALVMDLEDSEDLEDLVMDQAASAVDHSDLEDHAGLTATDQ